MTEPIQGAIHKESSSHLWLQRIVTLLYILVTFQIGVILVRIPWKSAWTENSLLGAYPAVQHWIGSYFVRGAVTGLGLLNLWIGVRETRRLLQSKRDSQ